MTPRIGTGPVFACEWLTTSRRWQVYAVRSLFVGALLAALFVVWKAEVSRRNPTTIQAQAQVGESFFYAIVGTQLALVLLAAPAATAGAICLDKARGNLAHLLVTDLSDAEIVLGKLAARLVPVLGFVLSTLPVMALGLLLGGIDPKALFGSFLVTIGVALLGCTTALALSVWGTRPYEVLLGTYAIWAVWLLSYPAWSMFSWAGMFTRGPATILKQANPFVLCLFRTYGAVDLTEHVLFLLGACLLTAVLAAVSVWRVRPVALRQASRGDVRREARFRLPDPSWLWSRLRPGPSLDPNPVLWREWHRNRPSGWTRLIWLSYGGAALFFSLMTAWIALTTNKMSTAIAATITNGLQIMIGMLLLSVSAASSLAEERVRGSLDALLTTPLSTRSILWGKWRGAFRSVWPMAVLPALVGLSATIYTGRILGVPLLVGLVFAYGAALTSLGLALATWVPRLGRAIGSTVAIFALVTFGLVAACVVLSNGPSNEEVTLGIAVASPFMGPALLTDLMAGDGPDRMWPVIAGWSLAWIVAYGLIARGLLMAAMATFDRRLGRMPADDFEFEWPESAAAAALDARTLPPVDWWEADAGPLPPPKPLRPVGSSWNDGI